MAPRLEPIMDDCEPGRAASDVLDVEGNLGPRLSPPGISSVFIHPDRRRPFRCDRVPGVGQAVIGIGLEDHLSWITYNQGDLIMLHVVG